MRGKKDKLAQRILEDPEVSLAGYQRAQRLQKERNQEVELYVDSA